MKKLTILLSSVLLLGLSFTNAMASDLKIGVIDLHKLIQQSREVKAINKSLQSQFKPRQERIVSLQRSLQSDLTKAKRDEAIMTSNEKASLQARVVKNKRDLQRMEQDYQQDLALVQNKAMQKFFAKLKKTVDSYASKAHYDLILQKDAVPYASSQVEVTKDILKLVS